MHTRDDTLAATLAEVHQNGEADTENLICYSEVPV